MIYNEFRPGRETGFLIYWMILNGVDVLFFKVCKLKGLQRTNGNTLKKVKYKSRSVRQSD